MGRLHQHPEPEDFAKGLRATLDTVHQQDMAGGRYCWAGAQSRLARPGRRSPLEIEQTIQRWHNIVSGDAAGLDDLLADDVVFYSLMYAETFSSISGVMAT